MKIKVKRKDNPKNIAGREDGVEIWKSEMDNPTICTNRACSDCSG